MAIQLVGTWARWHCGRGGWDLLKGGAMEGSPAEAGPERAASPAARSAIARSAPEVSVVARLAHLQGVVGNNAVVRLLGEQAVSEGEAGRAADPAP